MSANFVIELLVAQADVLETLMALQAAKVVDGEERARGR